MTDPDPQTSGDGPRRGLAAPTIRRGAVARGAIRTVRLTQRVVWHALQLLFALVILFEEWGWKPLSAAIARLSQFDAVARLEMWVRFLPPWPALAVFLVPSVLFLPLKLASLWLIGGGHMVAATLLFAFAKVAGTALYARIFQLTQPALMQLAWFARLYNAFVPWKEAVIAQVHASWAWQTASALKARLKIAAKAAWAQMRPAAMALLGRMRAWVGR